MPIRIDGPIGRQVPLVWLMLATLIFIIALANKVLCNSTNHAAAAIPIMGHISDGFQDFRRTINCSTSDINRISAKNELIIDSNCGATRQAVEEKFKSQPRRKYELFEEPTTSSSLLDNEQPITGSSGIITRTTEAIYRIFADMFNYDQDIERIDGRTARLAQDSAANQATTRSAVELRAAAAATTTTPRPASNKSTMRPRTRGRNSTTIAEPTTSINKLMDEQTIEQQNNSKRAQGDDLAANRAGQPHAELDHSQDESSNDGPRSHVRELPLRTLINRRGSSPIKKPNEMIGGQQLETRGSEPTNVEISHQKATVTLGETLMTNVANTHASPSSVIWNQSEDPATVADRRTKLSRIISSALEAIYSLTNLNRATRLAVASDEANETETLSIGSQKGLEQHQLQTAESGRLILAFDDGQKNHNNSRQTFATSGNIHLLCKLLNKQLELTNVDPQSESRNASETLMNSKNMGPAMATTTSAPTMVDLAGRNVLLESLSQLGEEHEHLLLESVFGLSKSARIMMQNVSLNETHEELAQKLLIELLNLGLARTIPLMASDTDEPEASSSSSNGGATLDQPVNQDRFTPSISMKLWSKSISGGRSGRLKLVYWLAQHESSGGSQLQLSGLRPTLAQASRRPQTTSIRLLGVEEANQLIDQLDQLTIDTKLAAIQLQSIGGGQLIRTSRQRDSLSKGSTELDSIQPSQPTVLDGTKVTINYEQRPKQPTAGNQLLVSNEALDNDWLQRQQSGLQKFFDRLANSSFQDNLYLYVILFASILFIIILCLAVPAICCPPPRAPTPSSASTVGSLISGERLTSSVGGKRRRNRVNRKRSSAFNCDDDGDQGRRQQIEQISARIDSVARKNLLDKYYHKNQLEANLSNPLAASNGKPTNESSIWRKLSNSTTILTKDESRVWLDELPTEARGTRSLYPSGDDATTQTEPGHLPRLHQVSLEKGLLAPQRVHRERPSFSYGCQNYDDNDQQLISIMGRKQAQSKDTLGKNFDAEGQQVAVDQTQHPKTLTISSYDRREVRNSDTLTKSELVMLKEKLMPIGRVPRSNLVLSADRLSEDASNRPQPTLIGADYVNCSQDWQNNQLTPIQQAEYTEVEAHGRASLGRDVGQLQKLQTSKVELPAKYGTKVEAIKNGLDRLERRDATGGTYKRYDDVA